MELIVFIIIIGISIFNAQSKTEGKDRRNKRSTSVWDQVDKSGNSFLNTFVGSARREQITRGVRDLEDVVNNVKRKTVQKAKQKEALTYQQEQSEWRKKQEEERKRRDFEERQKRKLELQKKEAGQRRKMLEKEKREREEKSLLERCKVDNSPTVTPAQNIPTDYMTMNTVADIMEAVDKSDALQQDEELLYRVEEYLDPLTSSFYPNVEDYLFPTIAPFYPDVDMTSFSLQNETNVL